MIYWWECGFYGHSNENYYLKEDFVNSVNIKKYQSMSDYDLGLYYGELTDEEREEIRAAKNKKIAETKRAIKRKLRIQKEEEERRIQDKKIQAFIEEIRLNRIRQIEAINKQKAQIRNNLIAKRKKMTLHKKISNITKCNSCSEIYELRVESKRSYWLLHQDDLTTIVGSAFRVMDLFCFMRDKNIEQKDATFIGFKKGRYILL